MTDEKTIDAVADKVGDSEDVGADAPRTGPQTLSAEGITVITLPAGEHISRCLAESKAEQARTLAEGVPRPLLIDIRGVKSIDRNARDILGAAHVSVAVAVLGSSPVDRVLGNFLMGGKDAKSPVAFFASRREALAWLAGFLPVP
jgi:hypothetical protein